MKRTERTHTSGTCFWVLTCVAVALIFVCLTGPVAAQSSRPTEEFIARVDRMLGLLKQMDALFASIDARKQSASTGAIHRFQYTYTFDPKGERFWSQISPTEWQEKYDTGETTKFRILERTTVEGDAGITAEKQDGTALVVFIPDKGGHLMWLRFHPKGQQDWTFLGEMTHIE